MSDAGHCADELPDDLADDAGTRLLATRGEARQAALAALVAAHPRYEQALRHLAADLNRVDGVITGSYPTSGNFAAPDLERIGDHRVIRRLGEGAFGVVYLCAQELPVKRQVAVKVVRAGAGGPETLRRFAAERQLLATLNHPTITQVFDAGEMADGRPFFVMEYVDGTPIRSYCDDNGLGVTARLRLFGEVCRGVAHAHARDIVHRDLKPANVLVVAGEDGPRPKIIDFGIAKALVPPADCEPVTEAGRIVGTPGYMSPEQASGRIAEVNARADVFALGVMFYELLTGELPWPQGAAADTDEPLRPSARVTTTSTSDARARQPQLRQRAGELRGDLDWITLKALARERDERYPSVAALAADIERHLRGESVSVGPPSLAYRWHKFARRNRTSVLVAGAAAVALAVVGWLAWQRTTDAESIAERAMAQATQAVERLVARASDASLRQRPENDAVRQLLAQDAIGFYDQWLRDRPTERRLRLGRCQALLSLSSVHWMLGRMPDAERAAAEAVSETEELFALTPDDLPTRGMLAEGLRRRGRALGSMRRFAEATALLTKAVEHLEVCNRPVSGVAARALSGAYLELAAAREVTRQPAESLAAARRAVTALEEYIAAGNAVAEAHTNVTLARCTLARMLVAVDRGEAAAAVLNDADLGLASVTLERQRVTARVHSTRALVAKQQGRWADQVEQLQVAVAADEQWHREEPARPLSGEALVEDLGALAQVQEQTDATAAADRAMQRAVAVAEELVAAYPDDAAHRARLEVVLSRCAFRLYERLRLPDLELAETWLQRAVELQVANPSPDRRAITLLAMVRESRGTATESTWEQVAHAVPADADVRAPGRDFDMAAWFGIARSRLRCGRLDEAAAALAQAERWLDAGSGQDVPAADLEWLRAQLALRRGDADSAVAAAERIVAVDPSPLGCWLAADCHWALAAQRQRAIALYRRVVEELVPQVRANPADPALVLPCGFACLRLAEAAAARGRFAAARGLLLPALTALHHVAPIAPRDRWQAALLARAEVLLAATQLGGR